MKKLGFNVVIEEGETGQFELFHNSTPYLKEGNVVPKFFTLADVERKLGGLGEY